MNLRLSILFIALYSSAVFSQNTGDCSGAVNICTNANFQITPNGFGAIDELNGNVSNPSTNPASGNSGCLLSGELNSTWMIINIATSGTLEFSFGQDNGVGCLDWIMWLYSPTACADIFNNTLAPVRCNWNGMCESFTGIADPLPPGGEASNFEPEINVLAGQQYLVCLSNYSSQTTTVPLDFFGTASVSCTTVIPITVNNGTICPGDSITLTASGATTYIWSPGNQTTASITVSPATTTIYTVTGTNASGSGTADATVTVLSPNDPLCGCTVTASSTSPVCDGQSFDLNASAISGATYNWSGPNSFSATGQSVTGISSFSTGTYTFTLDVIDANGNTCSATTDVVINSLPVINAGPDTTVCYNDSYVLNATGATSYNWTGGVQNGMPFTVLSSATYTVTGTDQNNCQGTDQVDINMAIASEPSITPNETVGCIPFQVTFSNQTPDAQNCFWTFGNSQTANGCGDQIMTYDTEGCFDVTLMVENSFGCDTSVTFPSIVCTETATASFYATPSIIGSSNQTVSFYNLSENATTYLWDFGDASSNSTLFEPTHDYPTGQGQGFLSTLIAYSSAGCSDTATFVINYEEQLIFYVPNAFTPDRDEFNQVFKPIFHSGFDKLSFHMQIFNRWGELVWESYDVNVGWDGSFEKNGVDSQQGTYTWIISFKPKNTVDKTKITGSVLLMR